MVALLSINIVLSAAIFIVVVAPLIWAIKTQTRDATVTAGEQAPDASFPNPERWTPETLSPELTQPREVVHS